jgi:hypothetical protein
MNAGRGSYPKTLPGVQTTSSEKPDQPRQGAIGTLDTLRKERTGRTVSDSYSSHYIPFNISLGDSFQFATVDNDSHNNHCEYSCNNANYIDIHTISFR